jgi:hypothetical protein
MQNSELDESTHRAIVDIAVLMLKDALTEPVQKSQLNSEQIE